MDNVKQVLEAHKKGHISTDEAQTQVLRLLDVVGRSEQLKAYTKWLRQNDHLQTAPFPPLLTQYLKSL